MSEKTLKSAIADTLGGLMRKDPDILVLGENVRTWGGANQVLTGLAGSDVDGQVLEMPVVENAIAGMALGAALYGLRPVAEIYSADFLFAAGNEVLNDIPKWRYQHRWEKGLCLVLRMAMGGAQEGRGPEHSQCIEAFLHHAPGLTVVVPGDGEDAAGCLTDALAGDDPVLFLEHRKLYPYPQPFDPGRARGRHLGAAHLVREGADVSIVAWGWMRQEALSAAGLLEKKGIRCEIVDPVTIKPMDFAAIERSVRKTGRLLVVEESPLTGSVGAEIVARAAEGGWTSSPKALARLAMPDIPAPYEPHLEAACIPDADDIARRVAILLESG